MFGDEEGEQGFAYTDAGDGRGIDQVPLALLPKDLQEVPLPSNHDSRNVTSASRLCGEGHEFGEGERGEERGVGEG